VPVQPRCASAFGSLPVLSFVMPSESGHPELAPGLNRGAIDVALKGLAPLLRADGRTEERRALVTRDKGSAAAIDETAARDYTLDLPGIKAPVLLIDGRFDRMVPFEVSIAILNRIADWRLLLLNNCAHQPLFENAAEWTVQVLAFLKGYWRPVAGLGRGASPPLASREFKHYFHRSNVAFDDGRHSGTGTAAGETDERCRRPGVERDRL